MACSIAGLFEKKETLCSHLSKIDCEVAANCHEFADYANLIGINSSCKMRWTGGQWPQQTQMLADMSQQSLTGNVCDDPLGQRQQQNQVLIDQQLHQQIQQQLCVEQFQLLNQLQNHPQQSPISLIPSAMELSQSPNIGMQSLPNQQIQNLPATGILQQQQTLSADAQQQTKFVLQQSQSSLPADAKFVFNVETDKTSPSLQLLFQLPSVMSNNQQVQQQQLPAQSQQLQQPCSNQAIAQTQTNLQQVTPNSQPQHILSPAQGQQHCKQHSQQVQVATQTQQTTTGQVPSGANHQQQQQQILSVPTETQTTTTTTTHLFQQQHQGQQQTIPNKVIGNKKGTEKSRKERNRYAVMRQAPAGSQANTTQQYPAADATPAPEKTIDVDSETDSNHDTALTMACAGGHEELVELLINRGANIEHRDKKGFTPLILAATAGHEKVVNTLLKQGAEIEVQSERTKDTPLSLACSGGRYEVVEILLGVGANKEHRNVSDYTPLSLAASGGYVNIIKLLLTHGAEINYRTGSKLGISPLMLAAMNGHTAAVKMLLDMGSDINAQIETNRNTALTLACFQGRHEVVSLLLDRKANVEHRAKTGLTPLMEAASGGYIEVGRVLLDKGADVNAAPVPSSHDTALTIAADKGHLKFVDLLLNRGAAVEVKNKKGNSPLWLAANGGHLAVVKVLYTHIADIDSQDNRRVSCLMAAFRKGHTKVVEWMVNHVTQFPSDQEMTRYISTVSDKELLEKCLDCVKTIRAMLNFSGIQQ